MNNPIKKKCLNCGYELQLNDESELTLLSECPKCHAIDRNVERILAEKERKKKLAEEQYQSSQEMPLESTASKLKNNDSQNSLIANIKSLILQNKILSRTMLIMAVLFMLIGFSIISKYHDVIIATFTNDPETIFTIMEHVTDETQVGLISGMETTLESKIPQNEENRKKWQIASTTLLISRNNIKVAHLMNEKFENNANAKIPNVSIAYYVPVFFIVFIPLVIIYIISSSMLAIILIPSIRRFLAPMVISIGIFGLLISLNMTTTVGDTYNIGLLNKKQNSIIISLAILIIGVILQVARSFSENKKHINN